MRIRLGFVAAIAAMASLAAMPAPQVTSSRAVEESCAAGPDAEAPFAVDAGDLCTLAVSTSSSGIEIVMTVVGDVTAAATPMSWSASAETASCEVAVLYRQALVGEDDARVQVTCTERLDCPAPLPVSCAGTTTIAAADLVPELSGISIRWFVAFTDDFAEVGSRFGQGTELVALRGGASTSKTVESGGSGVSGGGLSYRVCVTGTCVDVVDDAIGDVGGTSVG